MRIPFYIGTYTSGLSKGIYRTELDLDSGYLQAPSLVAEIDNPSFLTLHPHLPVLYSCSEIRRDGKREGSKVVAFRREPDGGLTSIGHQPSGGSGPCYVSTDGSGRVALVANYGSGSVSAFPLAADGALQPIATNIQHVGKSVNPDRQEGPHAHCIVPDPSGQFACAVDLGLDRVLVYALNIDTGTLSPSAVATFCAEPGQGPRHIAFHPDGKHLFVINEMGNSITTCRYNATTGQMLALSTIPTLDDSFRGENTTAEILVHPSGRFVYGSNRGDDSVVVYAFDNQTGRLEWIQRVASEGKTPRNFRLDPGGNFLIAANQDSDSVVSFRLDSSSGRLASTGHSITVGKPCCLKFVSQ